MNNVIAQASSSRSRVMNPSEAGISLGLGLTNECNLACAFATAIRLARIVSSWIK
jgi:hypothetical protein